MTAGHVNENRTSPVMVYNLYDRLVCVFGQNYDVGDRLSIRSKDDQLFWYCDQVSVLVSCDKHSPREGLSGVGRSGESL